MDLLSYYVWYEDGGKEDPNFGDLTYGEDKIRAHPECLLELTKRAFHRKEPLIEHVITDLNKYAIVGSNFSKGPEVREDLDRFQTTLLGMEPIILPEALSQEEWIAFALMGAKTEEGAKAVVKHIDKFVEITAIDWAVYFPEGSKILKLLNKDKDKLLKDRGNIHLKEKYAIRALMALFLIFKK